MVPSRLLTSLVLASSLILVLPRGWCCIFAALAAKADPVKKCCCTTDDHADPPAPSKPKPVKHCPCADRNTILADHEEAPAPELLPCGEKTDPPAPLHQAAPFIGPSCFELGSPPPLHLLKCSWLC